jgi:hypothetical protein
MRKGHYCSWLQNSTAAAKLIPPSTICQASILTPAGPRSTPSPAEFSRPQFSTINHDSVQRMSFYCALSAAWPVVTAVVHTLRSAEYEYELRAGAAVGVNREQSRRTQRSKAASRRWFR